MSHDNTEMSGSAKTVIPEIPDPYIEITFSAVGLVYSYQLSYSAAIKLYQELGESLIAYQNIAATSLNR